jgi:hypothetical protein
MPLPSITPYSPAQRVVFDALLAGAPPANITTVLDFLDQVIYNERDVMYNGLLAAPTTPPDEPVTMLTDVANALIHFGPVGFAYLIERFSVGTGGVDLLNPRLITPVDPTATGLVNEVYSDLLLAERQISISSFVGGTKPNESDVNAAAAVQGVYYFDIRAVTFIDPTHATLDVDVTPQGSAVIHLTGIPFDPSAPGDIVALTVSPSLWHNVSVAMILSWTPLITHWYLRVLNIPIIERPSATAIAIPCRIPQQALRFGLGELATWARVTENGTPLHPVGSTFLFTITHFPLLCAVDATVHLHRVVVNL